MSVAHLERSPLILTNHSLFSLALQVAQALDDTMSPEVQNHLFQEPGKHFGLDLAALNIQRGREHGVPSYNRWREWCGLPTFSAFEQMLGVMKNKTVSAYARCVVPLLLISLPHWDRVGKL